MKRDPQESTFVVTVVQLDDLVADVEKRLVQQLLVL